MAEPISNEEFAHFHRDGLKNLELDKAQLVQARVPELQSLDNELVSTLDQILRELSGIPNNDPEQIFKNALGSLDKIDAKRFLIENLLEALKRGEDAKLTLDRFKNLGLTQGTITPVAPAIISTNLGAQVETRKSIWKRVATAVAQIAVNAFKSIPKWIEIEPSITFVGPIPAISFALKGKGMSIHELFETLRGPVQQPD